MVVSSHSTSCCSLATALHPAGLNEKIVKMEYAVRGQLVLKAEVSRTPTLRMKLQPGIFPFIVLGCWG